MLTCEQLEWGPDVLGNTRRQVAYTLHGGTLRVYTGFKDSKARPVLVRHKLVSPDFIELLFKVEDGVFDQDLWDKLTETEQDLLSYLASVRGFATRELTLAIAKAQKPLVDRLRLIEQAVHMGNLSSLLVSEYCDIIDRLVDSNQMLKLKGSTHKNAIKRTFEEQQRENEVAKTRRRRI